MLDCQRGTSIHAMLKFRLRKAYDSVDHDWLCAMTDVHRLPIWLGKVIPKLGFMKGLSQGNALCPRLFTLCLNPEAWRLRETKGYRLSKPKGVKVTDLLYIDDLKVFAA